MTQPALPIAFAAVLCASGAGANTIEIMHFWISDSEASALSVFSEAYTAGGGTWFEDPQPNWAALSDRVYQRLREGFPPTAAQWLGSSEIHQVFTSGVLTAVNDLVGPDSTDRVWPEILPLVSVEGQIAAVPITIHGNNWSYYNAEIIAPFDFAEPASWSEFLDQMEALQAAGQPTIAIGNALWEHNLVFEMMLLARGPEALGVTRTGALSATQTQALRGALEDLLRFEALVRQSGVVTESWNAATLAVAEGRAAVQIMGDWAKGEMLANGFTPGTDFHCRLAPGTQETYFLTLDAFVLPRSDLPEDLAAQRDFVAVALDPGNQAEFSRRKGSLPVVTDVNIDDLDACGRIGLEVIRTHGFVSNHNRGAALPAVDEAFRIFLKQVVDGDITDPDTAQEVLTALLRRARGF